jgi:hypothetical protein
MKLYVPQCFLAFRESTVGKVPGKRGAAQRTFSGNRVQRMQDVYGELACGVVVKRRVRRQRVLDEF